MTDQSLPELRQFVTPFDLGARPVRIVTRNGDPWFFLTDVCRVLDKGNPSMEARALDDDEKSTLSQTEGGKINGLGAVGAMPTIISEGGLYTLILRSDKPQAKPFRKWITSDVIPSIRKTGSYSTAPAINLDDPAALRTILLSYAEKTLALQVEVATLTPKAAALERIEVSAGDMTPTAAAKILKVGPRWLLHWMGENGWAYRSSGDWVGHQNKVNAGYLTHKPSPFTKPDGSHHIGKQVMVTPKGVARLAILFATGGKVAA